MDTKEYLKAVHSSLIHWQRDHPTPYVSRLITAVEEKLQLILSEASGMDNDKIVYFLHDLRFQINHKMQTYVIEGLDVTPLKNIVAEIDRQLHKLKKEKRHEKAHYPCADFGFGPGRY